MVDGIEFTPAVRDTFLELGSSYNVTEKPDVIDIIDLYWKLNPSYFITFTIFVSIYLCSWMILRSIQINLKTFDQPGSSRNKTSLLSGL